jgi:hypothetical protein
MHTSQTARDCRKGEVMREQTGFMKAFCFQTPAKLFLLTLVVVSQVFGCPRLFRKPNPTDGGTKTNPHMRCALEKLRCKWHSKGAVDWPVVELLAQVSEAAYLPREQAFVRYCDLGFEQPSHLAAGSMNAYIIHAADACVIVFRGTDDIYDWLVNLDAIPRSTKHGNVHDGFYQGYHSLAGKGEQPLRAQLYARLRESRPRHLWVTGHSLGGALALVCACDLLENANIPLNGLLTFGQPRVFQKLTSDSLNHFLADRYTYFVNGQDVVPKVPPLFAHYGWGIWFTQDGIRSLPPPCAVFRWPFQGLYPQASLPALSEREFEQLKEEIRARRKDGKPPYEGRFRRWLEDHQMSSYLRRIRELLDSSQ